MSLPDVDSAELPKHYEGDLTGFSEEFVQARLDTVVDKIETRWGSLVAARLASGALKLRHYQSIVCLVATRVFRNPDGYKSEQEGQYSYDLSAAVASGTLWFTDDDKFDLTGIDPAGPGMMGTAAVGLHRTGWS